ncbi:MAG TPA: helix-turn-helix domain-containing protein, partial [Azospira sp.]|nr:helix-turn-helix domain-containing protein [Azospira sp.]
PVLLLKSASSVIAELCARSLLPPHAPWLDLAGASGPLTQEMLQKASGGILFAADLAAMGKLQQMNLAFALDRLEKNNVMLVCGTTKPLPALAESGWDAALLARVAAVWLALPQLSAHADEIPEIAALLLTQLAERGEVPPRRFAVGALNALRMHRWPGDWPELQAAVKNLALTALDEEIPAEDVARVLQTERRENSDTPSLLPFFEQPLRDARDAFESLYFEHHMRLEGGNMTRVAEKSGLERTHLYRKLKQLGIQIGRRGEE